MKKIILLILISAVMAGAVIGLTACGHEHTFEEGWSRNAAEHWHKATCEHSEETSGRAAHNMVDGACETCGYSPNVTEAFETEGIKLGVSGFEWGPSYDRVVIDFGDIAGGYDKTTFEVALDSTNSASGNGSPREIIDAFPSDAIGNKADNPSRYVTVQFKARNGELGVFNYYNSRNYWSTNIPGVILKLSEGKSVRVGMTEYTGNTPVRQKITETDRVVSQTASWHKDTVHYTGEGKDITLQRASWTPKGADKDSGKNPLVIWLHGAGEGGTDIDITLLGNEVTGLTTENPINVQHHFTKDGLAGAYVLAVQTPTMWMDRGDGQYNGTGTGKQESCYTAALWQAITTYVDGNPDVDTNRIYLGGCSNGGYMTMNMAFEHGDYFAAFYPICEAYDNSRISDDMIEGIKDYNIWFLQSADDTTVDPKATTIPTFYRLLEAGAENVHFTLTANVRGADDPTAYYMGHFSWVYAFNDSVKTEFDNSAVTSQSYISAANCNVEADMWDWIAEQTL